MPSTFLNCASLLCNIWYFSDALNFYPQRLLLGSYWESIRHILYCMPMSSMALVPVICHLVAKVKSSLVSIWYLTKIICLLQKPNKQTNKVKKQFCCSVFWSTAVDVGQMVNQVHSDLTFSSRTQKTKQNNPSNKRQERRENKSQSYINVHEWHSTHCVSKLYPIIIGCWMQVGWIHLKRVVLMHFKLLSGHIIISPSVTCLFWGRSTAFRQRDQKRGALCIKWCSLYKRSLSLKAVLMATFKAT